MRPLRSPNPLDLGLGTLAFGIPLAYYLFHLAPSIVPGDSGELVTAAACLGVPHPPGYPLWVLLNKVAMMALGGDPARAANILSALLGSLCGAGLYGIGRRILSGPLSALAAALFFAFLPAHASQAEIAEVYSLATLTGFLLVLGWVRATEIRGSRAWGLALYAAGIGIVAHYTNFLLIPGLMVFTFLRVRRIRIRRPRIAHLGYAGMLLLGLSPWLYLLFRSRHDPLLDWGDPSNLERWWAHIARRAYGGAGLLQEGRPLTLPGIVEDLAFYGRAVFDQFGPVLALAIPGTVWLYIKDKVLALCLGILLLSSGPLIVVAQHPEWVPALEEEMVVFARLSYGVLSLGMAAGIAWLAGTRFLHPRIRGPIAVAALLLGVGSILIQRDPAAERRGDTIGLALGADMLATLPDRSLLLLEGDNHHYSLLYQQAVLGKRPDVTFHDVRGMPLSAWTRLLRDSKDRPVYVSTLRIGAKARDGFVVPHGILYRIFDSPVDDRARAWLLENDPWPGYLGPQAGWTEARGRFLKALYMFHRGESWTPFLNRTADEGESETALEKALSSYELAGEIGAGIPEIHILLATRYATLGLSGRSVEQLEKLVEIIPRDAAARMKLAEIYLGQERYEDAAGQLRAVVEMEPNSAEGVAAKNRLRKIEETQNRRER